ncbi:MAG: hypothetical protein ABWY25_09075 [Paenisporosarcina sp.]
MSRQFLTSILLPADPASPLEAATKQYVDAQVGGTGYLPTTGGVLTGVLTIGGAALPDFTDKLQLKHPADRYNLISFHDETGRYAFIQSSDAAGSPAIQIVSERAAKNIEILGTGNSYVNIGTTTNKMSVGPDASLIGPSATPYIITNRIDALTQARFGHRDTDGRIGYCALGDGSLLTIVSNTKSFAFYQRDAAGTGFNMMLNLSNTQSYHYPPLSVEALLTTKNITMNGNMVGTGSYTTQGSGGGYYLVDRAGSGVQALIYNNANQLHLYSFTMGNMCSWNLTNNDQRGWGVIQAKKFYVGDWYTSQDWQNASYCVDNPSYTISTIAMRSACCAKQIRFYTGDAGPLSFINETGSATVPLLAAAYQLPSSKKIKKDIKYRNRTALPEDRVTPHHDSLTDDVPDELDIMALRPMVYRPKHVSQQIIEDDSEQGFHFEPHDPESMTALNERRERLGLVAEEVQHVIPSAVHRSEDGSALSIDPWQVTIALLEHVQQLTDEVSTLKYRIVELEGEKVTKIGAQ